MFFFDSFYAVYNFYLSSLIVYYNSRIFLSDLLRYIYSF